MKRGSATLDPAPPSAGGGGGGGGWAWVMTARGIIEAALVRGLIEASGVVPVVLDPSDPSPGSWMFLSGNVDALVRVYVPASMLADARLALLEGGFTHAATPASVAAVPSASGPQRDRRHAAVLVGVTLVLVVIAVMLVATMAGRSTCVSGVVC